MKSITSKYIITRRKELSNEITKYWNIIKNENVIPTGAKRNFDLKALILDIQAKAEERRAMAIALEQEMKAKAQEARAKVIEAEAEVPKAMAEAFRNGNLGIMDYYKMKNIMADTSMRETIARPEKK